MDKYQITTFYGKNVYCCVLKNITQKTDHKMVAFKKYEWLLGIRIQLLHWPVEEKGNFQH